MAAGEAVSPEAETNCFGCSPNNAKGLGLVFDETDDAVVADVLLGRGYEGYPGVVHGGIVALILDEAMGRAIWRTDRRPALTLGLRVRYVDFAIPGNLRCIAEDRPALVWLESPTNPMLKILDIAAISKAAAKIGVPVLVDNTFASPYFQRPLELGATLSLSSTTKYVNGHSDCLGGVVVTNDEAWNDKMVFAQKAVGLNPSPFDTWLIQRGVKTLALRMKQHHDNALEIAKRLERCPSVKWVRHPFLDSHPQLEIAKRQMSGGSGIVTFELDADLDTTIAFVSCLDIFALAESLGGIESLIEHPATMTHGSIPRPEREKVGITDGLVRLSVGIENVEDLIADLDRAMAKAGLGELR